MPWVHESLVAFGAVIPTISTKDSVLGILQIFLRHGAAGLLVLGIADSSFLILPFGNDTLLLIMIARNLFWPMIGFIVLCAIGTAYSVIGWIRRRRKPRN
jgi:hypothetical protein